MSYAVTAVRSHSAMKAFLRVPFIVRAGDPRWVAPFETEVRRTLNTRRNPYFRSATLRLFVCYRDDVPVARVAIVISSAHEIKFGERTAFFGFFDSLNDLTATKLLFDEADRYCREEHVETIEGPISPNHYSEVGLQISGFESLPAFFQPSNPSYYPILLETAGFRMTEKLFTSRNANISDFLKSTPSAETSPTPVAGWTVRPLKLSDYHHELERIREVFNDAFADNWHFLPVSREEYAFCTKFLKQVTTPDLIRMVEYRGECVGVLMCVLDINPLLQAMHGKPGLLGYLRFRRDRRHIRNVIIYAVGIKRKFQSSRAYALLLREAREIIFHYDSVETTWMLPTNILAVRAAERLGATPDKHFAIYAKQLSYETEPRS